MDGCHALSLLPRSLPFPTRRCSTDTLLSYLLWLREGTRINEKRNSKSEMIRERGRSLPSLSPAPSLSPSKSCARLYAYSSR